MADREEILRRLTLGDVAFLDTLLAQRRTGPGTAALDHVGEALVRLGALVAMDGSELTWQQAVCAALDAGLTTDEVVDSLIALAPAVGRTRVISVAPKLALAVGYDVEAAIEAR